MTTATPSAPPPMTAPMPYRFSVEDYERMIEAGIFDGEGRFEMIEGHVFQQLIPSPPHDNGVDCVSVQLRAAVPAGWRVRIKSGITLSMSVARPDVCVARGEKHAYAARYPRPADAALLVEVSDSTLAVDRGIKSQAYARDGVTEYWIVNVLARQIEVYTQPSGPADAPAYAAGQVYAAGSVVPLTLDGVVVGTIAVNDVIA